MMHWYLKTKRVDCSLVPTCRVLWWGITSERMIRSPRAVRGELHRLKTHSVKIKRSNALQRGARACSQVFPYHVELGGLPKLSRSPCGGTALYFVIHVLTTRFVCS